MSPSAGAQQPGAAAPVLSANSSSCASYAATHTLLEVAEARKNANGSLSVATHRATANCGPGAHHYTLATAIKIGTVTPSGTVEMLTGPAREQTVPHAGVSARLIGDHWGRIFVVTGPLTAITSLTELYHQ